MVEIARRVIMRCLRFSLFLIFLGLALSALSSTFPGKQDKSKSSGKPKQEAGLSQYYKKWLDEDALYIISSEERSVFKSLKNDEERESFIEQFWNRRNPDPGSSYNSFKEEHYRRIAYANEHFASGIAGWRSDRGRVYVMYGKPDDMETHPTGGTYNRPYNEGGGQTNTFPFEKWWYRHIDGVGDGIELEFVDSSNSGEYRLAMNKDEKDALMNVPNAGLTLAEEMGYSQKKDRAYFNPGALNDPNSAANSGKGAQDLPFAQMERYFAMQRPPEIKYKDLKTKVSFNISYNNLTCDLKTDYLKLTPEKALVPITIELDTSGLEFKREQDFNRAKVNIYGKITTLSNNIAYEWDDDITKDFNDIYFQSGKNKPSEYQKIVALKPGQLYKLELVLKDVNSKKMGIMSTALDIPKYNDSALQSSTIILADNITPAPANATQLDQYVIGDMRVVPRVKHEYTANQYLVPYMQIYNMQVDQTNQRPSLDVTFLLKSKGKLSNGKLLDGKLVEEFKNTAVNSEQYFYGQRVVLVGKVPLKNIQPGEYTLEIKVQDNIANRSLSTSTDFSVMASNPAITSANP
jgi:GWxTD domain-containing protein